MRRSHETDELQTILSELWPFDKTTKIFVSDVDKPFLTFDLMKNGGNFFLLQSHFIFYIKKWKFET